VEEFSETEFIRYSLEDGRKKRREGRPGTSHRKGEEKINTREKSSNFGELGESPGTSLIRKSDRQG